jgi:hypothetical protein
MPKLRNLLLGPESSFSGMLAMVLIAGFLLLSAGHMHLAGSAPEAASVAGDPAGWVIAILPFDALSVPTLDSYSGFALSEDEVMVVLPRMAVLPESEVADLLGEPRAVLERRRGVPFWISALRIPEYAVEGTGASFVYRGRLSTVIEADLASARDLMARGFTLSELGLRPLGEIMKPSLADVILDDLLAGRPLTEARRRFMTWRLMAVRLLWPRACPACGDAPSSRLRTSSPTCPERNRALIT